MVKVPPLIWLGVGLIGTYLIVTKTQLLGSITNFVKMHTTAQSMATKNMDIPTPEEAPSPFDFPMPPMNAPSSEPNQIPSQHAPPDMTKQKQMQIMEEMRRSTQMRMMMRMPKMNVPHITNTPPPQRTQDIEAASPFQQEQPEIGPIRQEPMRQPQISPVQPEPQRQPQIGPNMPNQGKVNVKRGGVSQQPSRNSGMPFNPAQNGSLVPQMQGNIQPTTSRPQGRLIAGMSMPTQNKGFTNGCGHSEGRDPYVSCRAGIGTRSGGKTTPESGNQMTPVNQLLTDPNHFFATYHFKIDPSAETVQGHPKDTEITGGYNGSNRDEPAMGVTIGVKPDGTPFAKIEDEPHHRFDDLCTPGQCGGVSKVPNLGNDYFVTWAADKVGDKAVYKGYVMTADGRQYKIAELPNTGIDFTKQNTYIRGRSNQLGNTVPSGILGNGTFMPTMMTSG